VLCCAYWDVPHVCLFGYQPDELFDSSYEGLLSLGETLGEVRSKATPADVIASLPTGTYQAWAKEDSETRCPICLDDARICQNHSVMYRTYLPFAVRARRSCHEAR
jgi:hypothetical protein